MFEAPWWLPGHGARAFLRATLSPGLHPPGLVYLPNASDLLILELWALHSAMALPSFSERADPLPGFLPIPPCRPLLALRVSRFCLLLTAES